MDPMNSSPLLVITSHCGRCEGKNPPTMFIQPFTLSDLEPKFAEIQKSFGVLLFICNLAYSPLTGWMVDSVAKTRTIRSGFVEHDL